MAADLMGDLMGEDGDELSLVGEGDDGEELGIRLARATLPAKGRMLRLPQRPGWRAQVAPGVGVPREAMQPLPLTPAANNGTFTSAISSINYSARPQRPFRGERLFASVARQGPSAQGILLVLGAVIVGTTVQQVEVGDLPLDMFAPTSFGSRMSLDQAQPGVLITAPVSLRGTLVSPDEIGVALTLLGRTIAN